MSQFMAKACMCDTWQDMCVTHGMPCVNMHGTFEHYIRAFTHEVSRISLWEQQRAGGREKKIGGKGKRKGGKERRKGEKEKKMKE